MRYFTPQRYIALQDCTSAESMDAADAEWEKAVQEYEDYLAGVRGGLPASVLALLEGHYLHDADVLSMGQHGDLFLVTLQLDVPPHELLTVSYTLAGEPVIDEKAFAPPAGSTRPRWLYEELECSAADEGSPYRHSVLLSNGWEVRVPFRDVGLAAARPVYPIPGRAAARSA
jgi:hypothetical protein